MSQYTIHEPTVPPAGAMARADATRFIKEGIAWWALLLPLIWLLYHRMWLVFAGFLIVMVALEAGLYYGGVPNAVAMWISILFGLVFAMHANDLRRWTLARRGFAMVGAVSGKDQAECELKYFAAWPEPDTTPAPNPRSAHPALSARWQQPAGGKSEEDAVIGLFPDGR